ncbi:formyl transferase-domain-containing protein [Multifurca ochricompacta]|uniref:Phosphoribosylglycinamide formyltransferase n=1 Tax=Multifurca ochricompacta TaxID=376703 RepID=A0AAD4QLU0_9AGAM|nr:formyl transferase-domain-containing protein [Multifurca ochricompacta]
MDAHKISANQAKEQWWWSKFKEKDKDKDSHPWVGKVLSSAHNQSVSVSQNTTTLRMADAAQQQQQQRRRRRRIVVLISGSGTNLQALIDAQNTPALPDVEIVLVISNRKAAYGLTRAANADPPIPTGYLALQPYLKADPKRTRDTYDVEIARMVLEARPDIVVLAGWMHVFSEGFLDTVGQQRQLTVINLHPALPGAFDGAHAIERSYEAFQKGEVEKVGAMVHRVVKEVDRGEPVIVREVEIKKDESLEAYEERLHRTEWEIIVEGTRKVLDEIPPT